MFTMWVLRGKEGFSMVIDALQARRRMYKFLRQYETHDYDEIMDAIERASGNGEHRIALYVTLDSDLIGKLHYMGYRTTQGVEGTIIDWE